MIRNRVARLLSTSIGLLLLAGWLFSAIASAQTANGTFTLPFETKWGSAILPAGHYSLTVDQLPAPRLIRVRQKQEIVAMVISYPTNVVNDATKNTLIIVSHGRKHVVKALELGCIGSGYRYTVPKEMKGTQFALEHGRVDRIPILASISRTR